MKSLDVFLVNGWGFDASIWDQLIELLEPRAHIGRIIALEINDWSSIDKLISEIDSDAILIAWSLGGNLAVDMVCHQPLVRGVILVNYNPCFCQRDNWSHAIPVEQIELMKRDIWLDKDQCLKQFYRWCAQGSRLSMKWLRSHLGIELTHQSTELLSIGLNRLMIEDQRSVISTIKCPVHMMVSEKDILIPHVVAQKCVSLNPVFSFELIRDASHLSPLIEPTNIAIALEKMLSRVDGPPEYD